MTVADAGLAVSLLESAAGFAPKRLLAGAGVEPDAGAEVVVDAPAVADVVAAEPAAGAPNKPPAGLGVDDSVEGFGAPPKRPPALAVVAGDAEEAVVVAGLAPNKPPAVAVVEAPEAAEVVAPPPPNRPPAADEPAAGAAGAAGLAPNIEVAVVEGVELPACEAAAGAGASAFAPNSPPAEGVEVDAGLAPKRPPAEVLLPDCAPPKRPPDGAAAVMLG